MLRALTLLALAPLANGQVRTLIEPATGAAPTFPVDVEIDVQRGPHNAPTPAAGIVIELGIGRKDDAPLHLDRPVLARVTSDERGMVRETLEVPERWKDDRKAWIWARVATPGLIPVERIQWDG